jgi:FtsP/CotA-like multicopper oxidase with cupredoxin domain
MKIKTIVTVPIMAALALVASLASAPPCYSIDYNLSASAFTKTMPDGVTVITMWGFALAGGAPTAPGPMLEVPPGETSLTINLTNNLPENISIVIPGQPMTLSPVMFTDGEGRQRVRSFTHETGASGGTNTYTWNNLKPGTYIYHSGTHPAKQVQMGLYGGIKMDAAAGQAYTGHAYDNEVILFYSEIDPYLHAAVEGGTYGTPSYPSTINYIPKYSLINGEPHPNAAPVVDHSIGTGERVLVRFLNAGLRAHVPTLGGGLYMDVIAEDGNLYPYPKGQYSVLLSAMKTTDAILTPASANTYPVYDRSLYLANADSEAGGMLVHLDVGTIAGVPVAVNDSYAATEDTFYSVAAPGVLGNDSLNGAVPPLSAALETGPSVGALNLAADGSFTYMPNLNFSGGDVFTYRVHSGTTAGNAATVTINVSPVSDAPTAANDSYTGTEGLAMSVEAPGVLGNDTDPDGDPLTAIMTSMPSGGALILNANGSFTYTPNVATTDDSFTYVANDGVLGSSPATVSITLVPGVNQAPVAVNDNVSTTINTAVTINLIGNDYDTDGTINSATVAVTKPSKGGTVINHLNGTVTFTPKKNFRKTDTFTYNVKDNDNATSNTATVRVNVQ